jgi:hypothetical protein
LYLLASALRRGSRQPGSRCTSAAAIRSASTPAAPGGAGDGGPDGWAGIGGPDGWAGIR